MLRTPRNRHYPLAYTGRQQGSQGLKRQVHTGRTVRLTQASRELRVLLARMRREPSRHLRKTLHQWLACCVVGLVHLAGPASRTLWGMVDMSVIHPQDFNYPWLSGPFPEAAT